MKKRSARIYYVSFLVVILGFILYAFVKTFNENLLYYRSPTQLVNGNFPDSYDELIKLNGIGDYTASAIASICFNKYNPVIDGNVLRFLSRFYGIKRPIDSITVKKEIKQIAYTLIIKTKSPGDFNQAMMEYGALVCKPFPDCVNCHILALASVTSNNL